MIHLAIIQTIIRTFKCFFLSIFLIIPVYANQVETAEMLESQCNKYEQENNLIELSRCQTKLAFYYRDNNNYRKAIEWMQKGIATNEKLGNYNAIKVFYSNIGLMLSEQGNYAEAIENFKKSLQINERYNKRSEILSDLINIALAQQGKRSYDESNTTLNRAQSIAQELNDMEALKNIYGMFSENYDKLGKPDKAKEYFELAASIKSHLQKQEIKKYEDITRKTEAELVSKELEKKSLSEELQKAYSEKELILKLLQQEKELNELRQKEFETKEKLQQAKQQKNNIIIVSLASILLIILLFLALLFKQLHDKKVANARLQESYKQIAEQKEEIEKQRDIANMQKKKITDSILYAQRIQKAVLPPLNTFERILPDHFILYKPRDIVSGDFYWMSAKDGVAIIAAADCTGHGVPGAFMSMLGIAFLNEIVNKITFNRHILTLHASDILNQLRENVINSLHQTGSPYENKDGMDISLCIIDFEHKQMQFAGAHNSAYLIRNGELQIIEADRMPIGIYRTDNRSFTNNEINLELGDQIYLFTDGFYDQIGGPKNMKLMSVNFRNYLKEIAHLPMGEQKIHLEEFFENWKGNNEQIDDVLVIGFKFSQQIIPTSVNKEYNWENVNILIAEDVDINYFLLVEALKNTRANIHRALNGKEAVELCRNINPDIILMDIRMPVMDGIEATREIRKFNSDIPIVAQTAFGDENDLNKISAAGCNDYITKPINLKTFLSVIKKHLKK